MQWRAAFPLDDAHQPDVSEEDKARLRAMGYVD